MNFRKYLKVNWFSTLFFNLKVFPLGVAVKLPILLFGRVNTRATKRGSIEFRCQPKPGLIRIGYVSISWETDTKRSTYQVQGKHIVHGDCAFGAGSTIVVGENGILETGKKVWFNVHTKLHCREHIIIEDACVFAWECQIMDTDFHYLVNNGSIIKNTSPIHIGYGVWSGNRVSINKGSNIPAMSVIASGSIVNKFFPDVPQRNLLAGSPAKVVRGNCSRLFYKDICASGGITAADKALDKFFAENDVNSIGLGEERLMSYINSDEIM